ELIGLNVDVLYVAGEDVAIQARKVSTTLPIVLATSGWPVERGLAASLAKPGGNVTGNTAFAGFETWGKIFGLLREAKPATKIVALVWAWPPSEVRAAALSEMRRAASHLGIVLRSFDIRSRDALRTALDTMKRQAVDALLVTMSPAISPWAQEIFEFAMKYR